MIINQHKGKSFSRTLNYVRQKPGAELLGHNMFCSTVEEQNEAMREVAEQSYRVKKPMIHYSISLAPGERLSGSDWRKLAKQYMKEMGYTDNQYLLMRHTDTPNHDHAHLVINRVQRTTGKAVCLGWDYYKSQALVRKLEKEFKLDQVRTSWEPFTERLPGEEKSRLALPPAVASRQVVEEKVRGVVNEGLLVSQALKAFINLVETRGVEVELRKGQGKLRGIAFTQDGERFTGSQLGKGYSLPKLMKTLEERPVTQEQPGQVDEPFHQRYYRELEEMVEKKMGSGLSTQQKDFQLAMLAIRSSRPDAAKALVFSPDVQRLKREQGEKVAMDYLRQLMESAQQQLRQIIPEKNSGRPERER